MDDTVGGRNVGRQDLRIVDLHLALVGLLYGDRMGAVQRVAHLIEAHAGREQCAGGHVAHHELGGLLLVAEQMVQLLLGAVGECRVDRREHRVGFGAGICK